MEYKNKNTNLSELSCLVAKEILGIGNIDNITAWDIVRLGLNPGPVQGTNAIYYAFANAGEGTRGIFASNLDELTTWFYNWVSDYPTVYSLKTFKELKVDVILTLEISEMEEQKPRKAIRK